MHEYFLIGGWSSMFNSAAQKVIKNAFKQAHLISIVVYYMQVLKQQMKPT
jgi:hypothetical protein